MRPRGEVRAALARAVAELAAVKGPVSSREAAALAQVGYEKARETLKDMVQAGEMKIAGKGKLAGERWHNLYEPVPADDAPRPWGGIEDLADAMRRLATAPDDEREAAPAA